MRRRAILGLVMLGVLQAPALADSALDRSALDLEELRNGDPRVQSSQDTAQLNQFSGQILIPAPASVVWEVLTDYDRLTDFMPGLLSSQVLERQGSQIKMEVRSVTQVFLAQVSSMAQLQMTEDPVSVLRFELLTGDTLTQLSGRWLLDRPFPNQVLLSYEATAAVESVPRGMFARLFRSQLERDLAAIRAEALRRL